MKKSYLYPVIICGSLLVALIGWLFFFGYLETGKPQIDLRGDISLVGKNKKIEIMFSDKKSGLADLKVDIAQDGKSQTIFKEKISARGVKERTISLTVNAVEANLHEGPAVINIAASDYSFFKNQAVLPQQVIIDIKPPQIIFSGQTSYFNQGGTGFFAYLVSKPPEETGIYVNNYFMPAFTTKINQRTVYVVSFALPITANKENTNINIYARDKAGNETRVVPAFFIKEKHSVPTVSPLVNLFYRQKCPNFTPPIHNYGENHCWNLLSISTRRCARITIKKYKIFAGKRRTKNSGRELFCECAMPLPWPNLEINVLILSPVKLRAAPYTWVSTLLLRCMPPSKRPTAESSFLRRNWEFTEMP